MPTHLPPVYPEETVHSLCSRLTHRMGISTSKTDDVTVYLFGTKKVGSLVDLPHSLDQFRASYQTPPPQSIESLIVDHTAAPFYAPFWATERYNQLMFEMGLSDPPEPRASVSPQGLSARHGTDSRIRYCPVCAAEQQAEYEEAYWLRLHQVVGVEVCPIHHLFLERTNIRLGAGYSATQGVDPRGFYYPAHHVNTTNKRPIDPTNRAHQLLVMYAEDAQWLLAQRLTSGQKEGMNKRIVLALSRAGYGNYRLPHTKNADVERLAYRLRREMIAYYSDKTLGELGLHFRRQINWLLSVIPNKMIAPTSSPMRYWLLVQFLSQTMQQFWALPNGGCEWHDPYPCLSLDCPNYEVNDTYSEPCKNAS